MAEWKGKTICLDFDGVLHSYVSGWTGARPIDPPCKGAKEFVQDLLDSGAKVVICSSRARTIKGREGMIDWLKLYKFPIETIEITDVKPTAIAYVDDRAVLYRGNFTEALHGIRSLAARS